MWILAISPRKKKEADPSVAGFFSHLTSHVEISHNIEQCARRPLFVIIVGGPVEKLCFSSHVTFYCPQSH